MRMLAVQREVGPGRPAVGLESQSAVCWYARRIRSSAWLKSVGATEMGHKGGNDAQVDLIGVAFDVETQSLVDHQRHRVQRHP